MCVIIEFQDNKPEEISKELLQSAEDHNRHGGGIAWIDNGVVKWEKGMHVTAKYIDKLIKKEKIQQPFVVHFRIATHGSIDTPLCHPFALSPESDDIASSGSDPVGVLFHNGVWSDYRTMGLKAVTSKQDCKVPDGDISDSRIMAWLVRYYGISYLALINEKVSVLTPKGLVEFGNGWTRVKGVRASNSSFGYDNSYQAWQKEKSSFSLSNNSKKKDEKQSKLKNVTSGGEIQLFCKEDEEDFRLGIDQEARKIDLEVENLRRKSINEPPITMEEYEMLNGVVCTDEDEDDIMPITEGKAYGERISKWRKAIKKFGFGKEDEEFDEERGMGYRDGLGIFHSYSDEPM